MSLPEDERGRSPSKQEQVRTWSIVNQVPGPHRRFTRDINSAGSGRRYQTVSTTEKPRKNWSVSWVSAFFHRFVPRASGKMASLTRLKGVRRSVASGARYDAFTASDVKATLLVHPQPDAPTEIWCDASNIAVGGVLVHLQHGIWKPLSFWSN